MNTVTNDNWNVGYSMGGDLPSPQAKFEPFKVIGGSWNHVQYPGCHGMIFPTIEAASAFALERGFLQPYYSRPWGFIGLKLSPATWRYVHGLPTRKAQWDTLAKLLDDGKPRSYFRAVRRASYMKEERERWNHYMDTRKDEKSDPRNWKLPKF